MPSIKKLNNKKNIENLTLQNGLRIEKLQGSIKVKGLHKINSFFFKIGKDLKSNLITIIYQLTLSKPFLIYNLVHDGSFIHPAAAEACGDKMIAGQAHIDLYVHHLRLALVLEDIKEENGPTVYYKNSMHLKNIKQNHLNLLLKKFGFTPEKGGDHNINAEKLNFLNKNTKKLSLTGKKGELLLIDLKSVHFHSRLKNGQRHLLWHFF